MEAKDRELIKKHRKNNYDLDKLMRQHEALETQIAELEALKGPTDNDQRDLHRLKKEKLEGMDRIQQILKTLN